MGLRIFEQDLEKLEEFHPENKYSKRWCFGSSPPSQTTSVQQSDPWSGVQPDLNQLYSAASNLYSNTGAYPQYFPGSTVAPMSNYSTEALQAAGNYGTSPSPLTDAATSAATSLLGQDAYNNPSNSTFTNYQSYANPAMGMAANQATNTPGNSVLSANATNGSPLSINSNLGLMASGGMLNSDPYLTPQLNAMNQNIAQQYQTITAPQTASQLEAAGRYGTGAYDTAQQNSQIGLANQLATADTTLLGQNYQNQTSNMVNAANSIQNAGLQNTAQQTQAASALGSNSAQALQNYANIGNLGATTDLNAATGLSNNFNNSQSNQMRETYFAPSVNTMPTAQIQELANAGDAQDQFNQANLNGQISAYNYNQTLPEQMLSYYGGLLQGTPGGTTSTSQPYYSNSGGWMGALGGGASGAAAGASFGPYGAVIGGALGALYGGLS